MVTGGMYSGWLRLLRVTKNTLAIPASVEMTATIATNDRMKSAFDALPERLLPSVRRLTALLRIAVLLHRGHGGEPVPQLVAHARGDRLVVVLCARWYAARPLLKSDLGGEPAYQQALGIELVIEAE